MNKSMEHAIAWSKALEAKANGNLDSLDQQLIDVVIAHERMCGWMSIVHEAMEVSNPFDYMVDIFVQQGFDYKPACSFVAKLLALGYAEEQGYEVTVETFSRVLDLAN